MSRVIAMMKRRAAPDLSELEQVKRTRDADVISDKTGIESMSSVAMQVAFVTARLNLHSEASCPRRLLDSILNLPVRRAAQILMHLDPKTKASLLTQALPRQMQLLKSNLELLKKTDLNTVEEYLIEADFVFPENVPENYAARIDAEEVFVEEIKDMMYSWGDEADPFTYSALILKDFIGDYLRVLISRMDCKPSALTISKLKKCVPRVYARYVRFLVARKECNVDEAYEALDEGVSEPKVPRVPSGFVSEEVGEVSDEEFDDPDIVTRDLFIPLLDCSVGSCQEKFLELRTAVMSVDEYLDFSRRRKSSFTSGNKKSTFCNWIGLSNFCPKEVVDFFNFVGFDIVSLTVQVCSMLRGKYLENREAKSLGPLRSFEITAAVDLLYDKI